MYLYKFSLYKEILDSRIFKNFFLTFNMIEIYTDENNVLIPKLKEKISEEPTILYLGKDFDEVYFEENIRVNYYKYLPVIRWDGVLFDGETFLKLYQE